jgi:hypothetical protein
VIFVSCTHGFGSAAHDKRFFIHVVLFVGEHRSAVTFGTSHKPLSQILTSSLSTHENLGPTMEQLFCSCAPRLMDLRSDIGGLGTPAPSPALRANCLLEMATIENVENVAHVS